MSIDIGIHSLLSGVFKVFNSLALSALSSLLLHDPRLLSVTTNSCTLLLITCDIDCLGKLKEKLSFRTSLKLEN